MPEETSKIRIAARLKLSAGVKPEVTIENLVRNGWPREDAVQAVAAEVEARKSSPQKQFKFIHTRKSLLDRVVDGAVPIFSGLGIMAAGVVLSVLFSVATLGFFYIVFIGLIATGFVTMLYGIANVGEDD